jgi:hypothetical protein
MEDTILITRPDHDDTTFYLNKWSEPVISVIEKFGKKLIDLKQERANRKNLESFLKTQKINLLFFNGHGTDVSLHGHKNEIILDLNNINLLNSQIVYSRSCRTAKTLGYQAVKNGNARAFIGYKNDFIFPYDAAETANPERDKLCTPVLETSNMLIISLIKGKSPKEAHQISQDTATYWIRKLLSSREIEAPHIIKFLLWNKTNQIVWEN